MMPCFKALITVSLTTAWLALAIPVDKIVDPGLDGKLNSAPTALDRINQLDKDSDWVFDFKAQPFHTYSPGGVVNANAATFPATVGSGVTMAWITLGPCGMLPPHYHPRATNIITAVEGETQVYMILENGARTVKTLLTPGKVTVLPTASVHTMQNTGCGNVTLISALNSDDAGTHNIANALTQLPSDMTMAAFGNEPDLKGPMLKTKLPSVGTGAAMGTAECMARCDVKS